MVLNGFYPCLGLNRAFLCSTLDYESFWGSPGVFVFPELFLGKISGVW